MTLYDIVYSFLMVLVLVCFLYAIVSHCILVMTLYVYFVYESLFMSLHAFYSPWISVTWTSGILCMSWLLVFRRGLSHTTFACSDTLLLVCIHSCSLPRGEVVTMPPELCLRWGGVHVMLARFPVAACVRAVLPLSPTPCGCAVAVLIYARRPQVQDDCVVAVAWCLEGPTVYIPVAALSLFARHAAVLICLAVVGGCTWAVGAFAPFACVQHSCVCSTPPFA